MDAPVTDIVFVGDADKAPDGYTVITECPCGHDAQLWEKVMGGKAETRYLCYTKKDKDDGKVVEDMYIPGVSQQYLQKQYSIITDTVEGDEPLHHKQLAVKRVAKSHAKVVVVDIIVAKSKDKISKLYTKLEKVNGLRIAFRTGKPATTVVSSQLEQLSIAGSGGGAKIRPNIDEYSPSPSTSYSPTPSQPAQPPPPSADLASYSPSPPLNNPKRMDNVVRVEYISPLASPPPATSPRAPSPPPASSPIFPVSFDEDASSPTFPVSFDEEPLAPPQSTTPTPYPPPTNVAASSPYPLPVGPGGGSTGGPIATYPPPQVTTPTPYPPPAPTNTATYPPPAGGPPGSYFPPPNRPSLPYQPTPPSAVAQYPTQGFNTSSVAFDHQQANRPAAGYNTSIGFSFGSSGGGGPAPYNPYHHQNQTSSPSFPGTQPQGGYPPTNTPWGSTPSQSQPPSQPGQQGQNNNYGFNI